MWLFAEICGFGIDNKGVNEYNYKCIVVGFEIS